MLPFTFSAAFYLARPSTAFRVKNHRGELFAFVLILLFSLLASQAHARLPANLMDPENYKFEFVEGPEYVFLEITSPDPNFTSIAVSGVNSQGVVSGVVYDACGQNEPIWGCYRPFTGKVNVKDGYLESINFFAQRAEDAQPAYFGMSEKNSLITGFEWVLEDIPYRDYSNAIRAGLFLDEASLTDNAELQGTFPTFADGSLLPPFEEGIVWLGLDVNDAGMVVGTNFENSFTFDTNSGAVSILRASEAVVSVNNHGIAVDYEGRVVDTATDTNISNFDYQRIKRREKIPELRTTAELTCGANRLRFGQTEACDMALIPLALANNGPQANVDCNLGSAAVNNGNVFVMSSGGLLTPYSEFGNLRAFVRWNAEIGEYSVHRIPDRIFEKPADGSGKASLLESAPRDGLDIYDLSDNGIIVGGNCSGKAFIAYPRDLAVDTATASAP